MAKDPALLWYFNDWTGGTVTLSRHTKGCYIDLLAAQFNNGPLSLDEIKTVLGSDFGLSWPTLQKKFAKDDNGNYYNERLQFEKEKRINYTNSRRTNRVQHMTNHMNEHMENRNENVNEDTKETKQPYKSISYLTEIPEEDLKELTTRFDASSRDIKSKAESLKLYCQANGRSYKNYKAFLVNAVKKDFKERKILPKRIEEETIPMTEEQKKLIEEKKAEIRKMLSLRR